MPLQLLIERRAEGWHLHGSAEEVMEAQRRQDVEARLQDRQADALEAVRDQFQLDGQPMDAATLAQRLKLKGKGPRDGERKARSTLDQLARDGLLTVETQVTETGRRKLYRPIGGVSPSVSYASQPSQPELVPIQPPTTTGEGRDEREGRGVGTLPLFMGSSWDTDADGDDPAWGPRPEVK